jgi:flagellar biosynthesis protein FlhF
LFRPTRLVFTHLDETAHFGGILACAMNLALPVSYLCAGQSVPEDIREASAGALIRLAMGQEKSSRAAAA